MNDDELTWEAVREGAAEGLAPVEADSRTGLPIPTVSVTPRQPAVWPWVVGVIGLLWFLSRK